MIDGNLLQHRVSRYSHAGEDGILMAIISTIYSVDETRNAVMCEFGAHDGSNSNLLQLFEDLDVRGVFIESDVRRFRALEERFKHMANVMFIHSEVGLNGSKHLKSILSEHDVDLADVRVISIDIDGDDAHVFASLTDTLDVLVIEYNPTFGFDTEFLNPLGKNIGSSPKSLEILAKRKNLYLAALTETNLIFVNQRFIELVKPYQLNELLPDKSSLRFGMGYDGTLVVVDGSRGDVTDEVIGIGWSKSFFVQPLPRTLRKFNRFNKLGMVYSLIILMVIRPNSLVVVIRKAIRSFRS